MRAHLQKCVRTQFENPSLPLVHISYTFGKHPFPFARVRLLWMPPYSLFLSDTVRELLTHVPASVKSEKPTNANYAIERNLADECNLTALHLAAFSGSENVVRTLLNSSGVDVEGPSSPAVSRHNFKTIPFNMNCQYGFKKRLKSISFEFLFGWADFKREKGENG